MFVYLRDDLRKQIGDYLAVSNVAGETVRKWRESLGLTLEALGDECPRPASRNRISDIESGRGSARVDTLLNIIGGIEKVSGRSFGPTDAERLARFFLGPSVDDALDRFESAAKRVLGLRRPRKR